MVYFYPKDDTRGCTAQACSFRDAYEDFKDAGAEVVGISADSDSSHERFAHKYNLPFILLADQQKSVRKQFGVKGDLLGLIPGRETFIFDQEGVLIRKFRSQMQWSSHAEEALQTIRSL